MRSVSSWNMSISILNDVIYVRCLASGTSAGDVSMAERSSTNNAPLATVAYRLYRLSLLLFGAFFASALPPAWSDSVPEVSAERIKAAVAYLASDRLEGRGPGTRGEILTTEYLADGFKNAGLKPIGERGTYFQRVPLMRVITSPKSTLHAVREENKLHIPCE